MKVVCHHCGFVAVLADKQIVVKCPRCNGELPTAATPEPAVPASQANAWLEMRRQAGLEERTDAKPWDGKQR